MKRKFLASAVAVLTILLVFSGCATSIAFDVVKPAEINMSEYSHLAIFDIEPYEFSFLDFAGTVVLDLILGKDLDRPTGFTLFMEKDISNKFERQLIYSLQQADYFTLIPPSQLRPFKNSKASGAYSNDILINNFNVTSSLIGTIEDLRFYEDIIEIETNVDDGNGGMVTIITESFLQEVSMDFSYSILDLRTNQIIATRYEKGSRRLVTPIEDIDTFRPPKLYDLYEKIINEISSKIRYQLAPRIEREYRFLEKDKTNNMVMETADQLVKDRNYEQALSLYLEIWHTSRNYAAGYNAAVLYEVMGQLQQAVSFMQDVVNRIKSPDAYRKLSQLEQELQVYNEAVTQIRQ